MPRMFIKPERPWTTTEAEAEADSEAKAEAEAEEDVLSKSKPGPLEFSVRVCALKLEADQKWQQSGTQWNEIWF